MAPVDGPALLKAARLLQRKDRRWTIELELTRLETWKVASITIGQRVALLGDTFTGAKGEAVLSAASLFVGNAVYGLRSSPAWSFSASAAACSVATMSSAVCAALTNPAS
jgi:hypothetical protein